ncbi:MAG: hypothetical protein QW756_03440 [Nitrososphaerota archaeon]
MRALASITHVVATLIFTLTVVRLVGKPSGKLPTSEAFILLSPLLLTAVSAVKLYHDIAGIGTPWWSTHYLRLAIHGFPASMIFGVTIRTIHFRIGVTQRKNLLKAAFTTYLMGLDVTAIAAYLEKVETGSALLLLFSAFLVVAGVDGFEHVRSGPLFEKMSERDRVKYTYFSFGLSSAFA